MTPQDIEKLKNLCDKEGFELDFISKSTQGAMDIFRVSKKDEWEGVEFAMSKYNCEIYPIKDIEMKSAFQPAFEEQYVEQLKAKAKKLYGKIKNGDRFERKHMVNLIDFKIHIPYDGASFHYYKKEDYLSLFGYIIYQQGKWAKKIETTQYVKWEFGENEREAKFVFKIPQVIESGGKMDRIGDYLSKYLEEYLNR